MRTSNAAPIARRAIPVLQFREFHDRLLSGGRVAALISPDGRHLVAVLAHDRDGSLELLQTAAEGSYPSLTLDCPQVHWFERELAEQWEIQPVGHPWLKPLRFQRPDGPEVGRASYFQVQGEGIHEVAVGPVHAGVIEPGHFRFQCHGEEVLHLEISLGYQHRGAESALAGGPHPRTIHHVETLAGDTSVGHSLAYCQLAEGLAGSQVPPRAEALRAVALELERLANHCGDLGALAGDVGYLPTASYCGRLRGDFLNLTTMVCGSRFGRGWIRPGGVAFDLGPGQAETLRKGLNQAMSLTRNAVGLMWHSSSVMFRMQGVGTVTPAVAQEIGLVGPPARASGLETDVRQDFPLGAYRELPLVVQVGAGGDVFSRAEIRWNEMLTSAAYVEQLLDRLETGEVLASPGALAPDSVCVSLVEGWRGEICHLAWTDSAGRFQAYKVIDPSFHNWFGLAMALRGQQISDFPLCNKSFNLSYCGHDL